MNNRLKLIAFAFIIGNSALAQLPSFEWAKQFSGSGNEEASTITSDNAGNVYSTGYFQGTTDFDPGAGVLNLTAIVGTQLEDLYISKLDPNGNLLWAKRIGGSGFDNSYSIVADNAQNVYVVGTFQGTVDFDPGVGSQTMTAASEQGYFVLKLDASGNYVWAKQIGGIITSIALDGSANPYIAGMFNTVGDFDPGAGVLNLTPIGTMDGFVLKLNSNGDLVWVKQVGAAVSGVCQNLAMTIDAASNVYATGYFTGTVDFDPGPGVYNLISLGGSQDIAILKLDAAGDFVWAKQLSGSSIERGEALQIDNGGNLLVTGWFHGTVDFDPNGGATNLTAAGANVNCFVAKLDVNGNLIWAKAILDTQVTKGASVKTDNSDNVYVGGTFLGTADFDSGLGTQTLTSLGFDDVFILKLDASGNFVWVQHVGSASYEGIVGMTLDLSNNIISTGYYIETCDFDPGPSVFNLTGVGSSGDAFVFKLSQCNNDLTAPVANVGSLPNVSAQCSVTSLTAPTATDNCAGTITGTHNASLPITAQGTTLVTWIYNDGNGNASTQTQNVVIADLTAPVANVGSLPNVSAQCSVTSLTAPTATDNCAGTITGTHNISLPITAQGTTLVTWTYNDGNGNASTQTQNVVIADLTAPVANVGSLPNVSAQCSVTSLTAPTATDNCAGTITGTHNASLPITAQGTTLVTWTYNDGNGNTSTQTQNVVIADLTAPVANVGSLPNVSAQCSVTSLTAPTATDNCAGTITGTHNASLPITAQGTTLVTWIYNDGNGNASTQTQNVVIADLTAPVANVGSLPNVSAQCSVTSLTAPTATDNCAGTITGTHNISLPITAQGTTLVTWTYSDGNGNASTQTQNVVIADLTAPVANVGSLPNVSAQCSVTSLTAPTATDNCAGTITGTHNASLPITAQGTTLVTWTYNDGNGNTSTQTQNVVIADLTAPVADITNLLNINNECEVTPAAPTATDDCSGSIIGTPDVTFPITAQGTTLITWTYNDGNGNTSTQTQNVVITPIDNGITQVNAITLSADATGYNYQWVDCANGNTAVLGATNQSFTPTIAGSYACMIDNGMCTVTTACLTSTLGIDEYNFGSTIHVYPNPTSGSLRIDFDKVYAEITVIVFNTLGQTVTEQFFNATNQINTEITGVPGMYLLDVQTVEGWTARLHVIKE